MKAFVLMTPQDFFVFRYLLLRASEEIDAELSAASPDLESSSFVPSILRAESHTMDEALQAQAVHLTTRLPEILMAALVRDIKAFDADLDAGVYVCAILGRLLHGENRGINYLNIASPLCRKRKSRSETRSINLSKRWRDQPPRASLSCSPIPK